MNLGQVLSQSLRKQRLTVVMPKTHQRTNQPAPPEPVQAVTQNNQADTLGGKVATVAAVGLAAALIETELIPGMLLGVAAVLAPDLLPRIGSGLRPLLKSAVRAGYSIAEKTRETVAEAGEQFQDIVAEVRSEQESAPATQARASAPSADIA